MQGAINIEPGGAGCYIRRSGKVSGEVTSELSGSSPGRGPSKCTAPRLVGGAAGKAGRGLASRELWSKQPGPVDPGRMQGDLEFAPIKMGKVKAGEWQCDFHCSGYHGNLTCMSTVVQM